MADEENKLLTASKQMTNDLLLDFKIDICEALRDHYRDVLNSSKGGSLLCEVDATRINLNFVKCQTEESLDQETIDKTKDFIISKTDEINREMNELGVRLNDIIDQIWQYQN